MSNYKIYKDLPTTEEPTNPSSNVPSNLIVIESKEHKQHLSWTNHSEIDLIMNLISHLIWLAGNDSPLLKQNIGIITPYRG